MSPDDVSSESMGDPKGEWPPTILDPGFNAPAVDNLGSARLPENPKPVNVLLYIVGVIAILLVCAVVVSLLGLENRTGEIIRLLFQQSTAQELSPPVLTTIVDTRENLVLMSDKVDDVSRILVQRSGQEPWLLLSGNDTTATNPALSPDATRVVYLSQLDGGKIVITPIDGGAQQTLPAIDIRDIGLTQNASLLQFCPWTPIAWNPAGDRLAFFGCDPNRPFSTVIVSGILGSQEKPDTVPGGVAESTEVRQVIWLNDTQLIVTVPVTDTRLSPPVITLNVPVP